MMARPRDRVSPTKDTRSVPPAPARDAARRDIQPTRVVAMPQLGGVEITGVPVDSNGLIRTDTHGRVDDLAMCTPRAIRPRSR